MRRLLLATTLAALVVLAGCSAAGANDSMNQLSAEAVNGSDTCRIAGGFDPSAVGDSEGFQKIVVEYGTESEVFSGATSFGHTGVQPGAAVSVFAVSMPRRLDNGEVEVLFDGHLNADCQLVGERHE